MTTVLIITVSRATVAVRIVAGFGAINTAFEGASGRVVIFIKLQLIIFPQKFQRDL